MNRYSKFQNFKPGDEFCDWDFLVFPFLSRPCFVDLLESFPYMALLYLLESCLELFVPMFPFKESCVEFPWVEETLFEMLRAEFDWLILEVADWFVDKWCTEGSWLQLMDCCDWSIFEAERPNEFGRKSGRLFGLEVVDLVTWFEWWSRGIPPEDEEKLVSDGDRTSWNEHQLFPVTNYVRTQSDYAWIVSFAN